jgi:hypothetical protein
MDQIYQAKFYCNPYSLLVIDKSKKLRRVFCPFKVKAQIDSPLIRKGKTSYVSLVRMKGLYGLIFVIDGKEYESSLFGIIL